MLLYLSALVVAGVAAAAAKETIVARVVSKVQEATGDLLTGNDISKVRFVLYTTSSNISYPIANASELPANPLFDRSKPTAFYAHGWRETNESGSIGAVSRAFLHRGTHNFVLIDWSKYVPTLYIISSLRVPAVAEAVGKVINSMVAAGVARNTLWLIGHSLGGQLMGAVTKYLDFKPTRITALDPAGPLYTGLPATPGLTRDDADMVDVIHTDAGLAGYAGNDGTVDFWPNEGKRNQPGCSANETGLLSSLTNCSHRRSWHFFAASAYNDTAFPAVSCNSWKAFKKGSCPINATNVVNMGFGLPATNLTGTFFLRTGHELPYGLGLDGACPPKDATSSKATKTVTKIVNKVVDAERRSLHVLVQPALKIGQIFGMFPADRGDGRFHWCSLRTVLWFHSVALLTTAYAYGIPLSRTTSELLTLAIFIQGFVAFVLTMLATLRVAMQWRSICRVYDDAIAQLQLVARLPDQRRRLHAINAVYIVLLIVAAVTKIIRHQTLSRLQWLRSGDYAWEDFSESILDLVTRATVTSVYITCDLFLAVVSDALAQAILVLNVRMRAVGMQETLPEFWEKARRVYRSLSELVVIIDGKIGLLMCLCVSDISLYFCKKLLFTVQLDSWSAVNVLEFLGVAARLFCLGFFTSSVHQQWLDLKCVLYSVQPKSSFVAVMRFSMQLQEELALTGLGTFSLTRPFLLSVIGFLVTLETVLLQTAA